MQLRRIMGDLVQEENPQASVPNRRNAVVKTAKDVFIFEFKLHGTAEEAFSQIRDLRYADR